MARAGAEKNVQTAENVFRDFLHDRGLKYTGERKKIVRAVMMTDQHFEVEELLRLMWEDDNRVGKATVYRTLKLLVECGIVKEAHFSNKQVHYEHIFGEAPHDHMICRRCGRIIEFDAGNVLQLTAAAAAEHGFHAIAHRFQIIGLCKTCVESCPVGPRVDRLLAESRGSNKGRGR